MALALKQWEQETDGIRRVIDQLKNYWKEHLSASSIASLHGDSSVSTGSLNIQQEMQRLKAQLVEIKSINTVSQNQQDELYQSYQTLRYTLAHEIKHCHQQINQMDTDMMSLWEQIMMKLTQLQHQYTGTTSD